MVKNYILVPTSAQIFPTVEIVSTGYNPRKVSAPRTIASLPTPSKWKKQIKIQPLINTIKMEVLINKQNHTVHLMLVTG